MYIFGGSTADYLLNDLWSFNLVNYSWKKIEFAPKIPLPSER